jgi:hypothetical protein
MRNRGLAVWVGFALAIAAVAMALFGVVEWTQREKEASVRAAQEEAARRAASQRVVDPPSDVLTREERDAAMAAIHRTRIEAARIEREAREEHERLRVKQLQEGTKCLDGLLFKKEGNEWRELGRC